MISSDRPVTPANVCDRSPLRSSAANRATPAAQRRQLRGRRRPQPARRIEIEHARQGQRARPAGGLLSRRWPALAEPAPHQPPPLVVLHGLRRIETRAQIHPAPVHTVVGTRGIRTSPIDHGGSARMSRHHQYVPVTQREEIGTFPHRASQFRVAREELPAIAPVDQVGRRVVHGRAADAANPAADHLMPAVFFRPYRVVPEAGHRQPGRRRGHHRVGRMLRPSHQPVITGRNTGTLREYAGIHESRHAIVVHRTTRIAAVLVRTAGRGRERHRPVLPMHQIVADGVSPVLERGRAVRVGHIAELGGVLVEQVVAPLPLDEAVGIVHPPRRGQEMVARAVTIQSRTTPGTIRPDLARQLLVVHAFSVPRDVATLPRRPSPAAIPASGRTTGRRSAPALDPRWRYAAPPGHLADRTARSHRWQRH